MKIVLGNDIFTAQKSGGISVVWKNIILALQKFEIKDIHYIEYQGAEDNICRKELTLSDVEVNKPRLHFRVEKLLDPNIDIAEPFIYHCSTYRTSKNKNAINIVTVHDFTYEYFRRHKIGTIPHIWRKYHAIRNADYVVCISENTKKDIFKFLPDVDAGKIRIIYNGVSKIYRNLNNPVENPYGKYVLFVGSRISYKNFYLTVDALQGTDYKLVVVGPPLNNREQMYVNRHLKKDQCIVKGRISDEELNVLYNNAYCLAYPSSYEGFGIPVLEAQRAGCPVIAYNGSSIPEVIGDTPLLLDNLTVSEFRLKLSMLADSDMRQKVTTAGFENSKRFSWEKMGEEYIALYKEIEEKYTSK